MRITSTYMINDFVYNMQTTYKNMEYLQQAISSGKTIQKSSDNPVGAGQVLSYTESLSKFSQATDNLAAGTTWLKTTDAAIQTYMDVLQRVQELAVDASDGTKTAVDRKTIGVEVNSLLEQVVTIANSTQDGLSIFSGGLTQNKAFTTTVANGQISSVAYQGDSADRQIQVSDRERLTINTLGSNDGNLNRHGLFIDSTTGLDIFKTLIRMRDDLEGNTLSTGTATGPGVSPDTTTLQDTTQAWSLDELAGYTIRITSGTGAGQEKTILSNGADTIKVDSAWTTAPDATSQYEIVGNWTNVTGQNTTREKGAATAGTADSLTADPLSNWAADRWAGYRVVITGGTGAGQERIIQSNTGNALTVSQDWDTVPDATTTFRIEALPEHPGNNREDELSSALQSATELDAYLGNKESRVTTLSNAYTTQQSNTLTRMDAVEGTDLAEAMMKFSSYQQVYQATAMVGAKILPQSLLNFLQ